MRKIADKKGFTLIEMLMCIVILLMVASLCTTGMNYAFVCYQDSVFESDSQMLEDTLNMYIGDILRHATDVKTSTGELSEVEEFTNTEYQIFNGNLVLQEKTADSGIYYLGYTSIKDGIPYVYVVAGEMVYAKSLYIDNWSLNYDAETGVFTGSYIIKSVVLENASRECTFTYRTIASY